MTTIDLYSTKDQCCGCSMCVATCPKGIISMKSDEEGFLYPHIENVEACLDCKKCISVCPLKRIDENLSSFVDFYAGSITDREDLVSCSSGGAATDISRNFIINGGVVYGAAYSNDWKAVEYIRCDNIKDVEHLKTSKYAQAEKKDIYKNLLSDLKGGKQCLFIGLPCDVAAIVNKYGEFSNLFTIELVCHGPTSNKVNEQYCEYLEKRFGGKLKFFSVRYKKNGKWKPFYICATFDNGKKYVRTFHESEYGAAFRYLKRPSCYKCNIKGGSLRGDMMLGDYHYVEKGMIGFNPNGVSSILIHNEKGKHLLSLCKNSNISKISPKFAKANRAIFNAIEAPSGKEKYTEVFISRGVIRAGRLGFVKFSNFKRTVKSSALSAALKIKRIIIPTTKLHQ